MPPFKEESEGEVLMAEVTLWFDDEEDCERVDERVWGWARVSLEFIDARDNSWAFNALTPLKDLREELLEAGGGRPLEASRVSDSLSLCAPKDT